MKKLILVTGEKGGVGKSFFARSYISSIVRNTGEYPTLFDTDEANPTLTRYYKEISNRIGLGNPDHMDQIVNAFEDGANTVIVDGAARSLGNFITWMRDLCFEEIANEMGIKVELCFVINSGYDSLQLLNQYVELFGASVEWKVILNSPTDQTFQAYFNSNTRRVLKEELGAIEIKMPILYSKVVEMLDKLELPFEKGQECESFRIVDRQRVKSFNQRVDERLGIV